MIYHTNSPEETEAVGQLIASRLQPGTIIAFEGDLGAGKTAFTRGLARGLGAADRVTSPTYTIVNEYLGGRRPLFHFDMYRLHSSDDLFDIGWEDYLERGGICAVEWIENVSDAIGGALTVRIEKTGDTSRTITLEGGKILADLGL
jgi:tRNA threonylcarbamoyladenosine biosynthesis protein TsaE